jgi:hypothetical protein
MARITANLMTQIPFGNDNRGVSFTLWFLENAVLQPCRKEEKSGARLSPAQNVEKSLAVAKASLFSLSFTLWL